MLSAYGRYKDELTLSPIKEGACENVPGSSGLWKITKRQVTFVRRIGDELIMTEF
jgi:hypothetical protein